MRIGLFGGTFNPVHLGHLRAAVEVRQGFELDEIFLIPAALPPHKVSGEVAASADRLHMLKLALDAVAGLRVSDVELNRSGPSYTIDTVHHFKQTLPAESSLFLIMGLDAFLEIDTWKSYRELLTQIPLIVVKRPRAGDRISNLPWKAMDDYVSTKLSADYSYSASRSAYLAGRQQPIYVFEVTALDISSTRIRRAITRGRSIDYLVPPKVAEY
ncbi:MAG: nicotinate-nucleotide adenylyltransferase, partial [Desulfobacteraceae bacterium]|nr:nicotinate-nucleotide adenylyltransferase [Desulfobacteraceae bacterium]